MHRYRHSALHLYTGFLTLALPVSVMLGMAADQGQEQRRFAEIDVERINIVEADGQLRMVIANRARQHPGQVDGQLLPRPQGRPPGIIFFNHRGDECGGLIFDENGGLGHFVSLTMDKSRQDQTIGMQHLESDDGRYFAGLRIWDRPHTSIIDMIEKIEAIERLEDEGAQAAAFDAMRASGELGATRVVVGKLRDEAAQISLADGDGQPRIRLSVSAAGEARIEFLNAAGEVVKTISGE